MGLIQAPAIKTYNSKGTSRYIGSFSYDFGGDQPTQQTIGAQVFQGASFLFDPSSIPGNIAQTPVFRSMCFLAEFSPFTYDQGGVPSPTDPLNTVGDGPLIVNIPSSGMTYSFGTQPQYNGTVEPENLPLYIVTGVVPIVCLDGKINFLRGYDSALASMFGKIFVTLYDEEIPPFITTSFSQLYEV